MCPAKNEVRGLTVVRSRIIITKQDKERLENLFMSSFVVSLRDKPCLKDLRGELNIAEIVAPEDVPADVVTMNSTVQILDLKDGDIDTYTLVYPREANIAEGRLSVLAPIGTAILGCRVGDVVRWKVPGGISLLRIEQLVFQPEHQRLSS